MIARKWIRTCQDCGNKQENNKPVKGMGISGDKWDTYFFKPCKRCGHRRLDFGTFEIVETSFEGKELTRKELEVLCSLDLKLLEAPDTLALTEIKEVPTRSNPRIMTVLAMRKPGK